jgi:stage III sporulation protein AF
VLYVETIYLLARNIVFVILIAVFIEMLLPLKETRKSVEVVVGLFVLITLLNPIVSFIQQEPLIELEMAEGNEEQLQQILDQGKELQQLQTVQTESYYGKHLEEQIAAFACIVPEVEKADARVQFVSGSSQDEVGVIERIEIFIKTSLPTVDPVEEVKIGSECGGEAEQGEREQDVLEQVQKTVASLCGLETDAVVVTLDGMR